MGMAVSDYKQVVYALFEGDTLIETSVSIEGMFKSYLKHLKTDENVSCKIVAGVQLKRRQNIESYKIQVSKGVSAHRSELRAFGRKLGVALGEDFDELVKSVIMFVSKDENKYAIPSCTYSFLVIDSCVKLN